MVPRRDRAERHLSPEGRRGPPPEQWYLRWRNHLLINSLREASAMIQAGRAEIDPSTFMRWFILPIGAIMGGFSVNLVKVIMDKLDYYLPTVLFYILGIIVVLGGPDILPPLTLVNGCESLMDRVKWTALFIFINYAQYLPDLLKGHEATSSFNVMMIISGLWHIDRGDYNYKMFTWICSNRSEYHLSEDNVKETLHKMALYHFQAAAGVGMLWAVFGVYSPGAFFQALVIYSAANLSIYCCLGGGSNGHE